MWLLAAAPARMLALYTGLAAAGLVGTAAVNRFTSNDGRQPAGSVQSRGHQQPRALQIN